MAMNINLIKLSGLVFVLAAALSCTKEDEELLREGIYATVDNPVCGTTKALSGNFEFSFAPNDQINVYPQANGECMTYALTPVQGEPNKARFKVSHFNLKSGVHYAVYPAMMAALSPEKVLLPFTGQTQTANKSSEHLSKYDYNWSTASVSGNSATFAFKHKVSWLKMSLPVKEKSNFTEIVLHSDSGVAGTVNLDATTGEITMNATGADTLSLSLGKGNGIDVEADGVLTAYMTIPAGKYKNLTITARENNSNNTYLYKFKGDEEGYKEFEAGTYYAPTLISDGDTPFTAEDVCGYYEGTDTEEPEAVIYYDEDKDQQLAYDLNISGTRSCKIIDFDNNTLTRFVVTATDLKVGEAYTISTYAGKEIKMTGTYTLVRKSDSMAWFNNIHTNNGYIIAVL